MSVSGDVPVGEATAAIRERLRPTVERLVRPHRDVPLDDIVEILAQESRGVLGVRAVDEAMRRLVDERGFDEQRVRSSLEPLYAAAASADRSSGTERRRGVGRTAPRRDGPAAATAAPPPTFVPPRDPERSGADAPAPRTPTQLRSEFTDCLDRLVYPSLAGRPHDHILERFDPRLVDPADAGPARFDRAIEAACRSGSAVPKVVADELAARVRDLNELRAAARSRAAHEDYSMSMRTARREFERDRGLGYLPESETPNAPSSPEFGKRRREREDLMRVASAAELPAPYREAFRLSFDARLVDANAEGFARYRPGLEALFSGETEHARRLTSFLPRLEGASRHVAESDARRHLVDAAHEAGLDDERTAALQSLFDARHIDFSATGAERFRPAIETFAVALRLDDETKARIYSALRRELGGPVPPAAKTYFGLTPDGARAAGVLAVGVPVVALGAWHEHRKTHPTTPPKATSANA